MTGRTIPRNLTLTTASLKDEPYESQVRVLRWIRALLSEVADKASSQAQSSSRRGDSRGEHHDQDEREAEDPQHEEKKSGSAKTSIASACTVVKELESADVLISVMEPKKDEDGVTEMFGATNDIQKTTSSSLAPVQRAESSSDHACEDEKPGGQQDVAVKGNGRKRGRELTPRSPNLLTVGRVVECFHPDDGLWYPATVTDIIAPPTFTPDAKSSTTPAIASKERRADEEGLRAPSEEGLRIEGHDKQWSIPPTVPASPEGVAIDGIEACDKAESQAEGEGERRKLLKVTFLGFGNEAILPVDWAREVVTPEVLDWCRDNGFPVHPDEGSAFITGEDVMPFAVAKVADESVQASSVENGQDRTSAIGGKVTEVVKGSGRDGRGKREEQGGGNDGRAGGRKGGGKKNRRTKKKKKDRSGGAGKSCTGEDEEVSLMRLASKSKSPYPHVANKYWGQRYRYFSRFDEGVAMDKEGWYSVTPEAIARHIAERMCFDTVVDPFVGCGGNAVQFALVSHLVFAIDIDPARLEHARRNAAVYGVENRIEFILGDAMKVLATLRADAVFLSPPWGGPAYQQSGTFDLHSMIPPPLSALEMFRAARRVTPNVAFYLPRNVDPAQIAGLPAVAATADANGVASVADGNAATFDDVCELEKQVLNGKLKTITAYFGQDIVATGTSRGGGSDAEEADASLLKREKENCLAVESTHSCNGRETAAGSAEHAPAWSGRHVRFSDDQEGTSDSEPLQEASSSVPQTRENGLYAMWMAAAAKTR